MQVRNIHERRFNVAQDRVAVLLDGLASHADRLWPSARWPAMRLDRPLQVGAGGGHGPIHYRVEIYEPGSSVRFRLHAPSGFDGFHAFEVVPDGATGTTLRHVLDMNVRGPAMLTWPILFRPLHDALLEDCLDTAAGALGEPPRAVEWSLWVRTLRRAFRLLRQRRSGRNEAESRHGKS